MFSPKRDTMHLHNKPVFTVFFCFLMCVLLAGSAFALPPTQQSQSNVQPTPLPSDVDPSDPALPVWMRPATPPPGSKNTNATPPSTSNANTANVPSKTNVPPNQQPQGRVGE